MRLSEEQLARAEWTRITEAQDVWAHRVINQLGAANALSAIDAGHDVGVEPKVVERWRLRRSKGGPITAEQIERSGLALVTPDDAGWPSQLDDLGEEAPHAIWVRGEVGALSGRVAAAIVGSRTASSYGSKIARDIAYEIAQVATVVSGGAFGIDAQAHSGALLAGQPTVIVSAGGADRIYPLAHQSLFESVLDQGGAVVSESPPGAAPQRHRFLSRNRLIAALGEATLVVEAPIRSGALSTARHAMSIGRSVGAVPGPITSPGSAGCIELLRNGATAVASAEHLKELIGPIGQALAQDDFFRGAGDDPLLKEPRLIRTFDAVPVSRPVPASSIAATAGLTIPETIGALGRLALAGYVEERSGSWIKVKR